VGLEVVGELFDARGEQRHLHLGRTAVFSGSSVVTDDFLLASSLERHQVFYFFPLFIDLPT
jgi:hypothetical protein